MDNNFNQMNDQSNGQMNNQMNSNAGISEILTDSIKSFDVKNTLIGAAAALVATILGTIIWVFITGITGTMIFIIAFSIAFLAIFAYEKLAKKIDIIGVAICLVLAFVGIYFGVRYGYIYHYARELDTTMKNGKAAFELVYEFDSSLKADYIKNMLFSYIVGLGYGAVFVINKYKLIKKK